MSYARSPRPDFSMTIGISWFSVMSVVRARLSVASPAPSSLNDLQLVALGVAEADDPAAAGRGAGLGNKFDATRPQEFESLVKIAHAQCEVPQTRGEPSHRCGIGPAVARRHQLDHGAVLQVLVVPDQR